LYELAASEFNGAPGVSLVGHRMRDGEHLLGALECRSAVLRDDDCENLVEFNAVAIRHTQRIQATGERRANPVLPQRLGTAGRRNDHFDRLLPDDVDAHGDLGGIRRWDVGGAGALV
jgi:hypothetical protein